MWASARVGRVRCGGRRVGPMFQFFPTVSIGERGWKERVTLLLKLHPHAGLQEGQFMTPENPIVEEKAPRV